MPPAPEIRLAYSESEDITVIAFRNSVGGWSYLRDQDGRLASIATGYVGSSRRDQLEQRYSGVHEIFRSLQ